MKRTYITFSHGYENNELTKILRSSVREFSKYGLIIYNSKDFEFDYDYDNLDFWNSGFGYIMKIHSCIKSLVEYDEVVWLDTDIVVNHNIDNIWKKTDELENYPLLPYNRFANYVEKPISVPKEKVENYKQKIFNYFELDDKGWFKQELLQACFMLFNSNSKQFFFEVLKHFGNHHPQLPHGDESIINGLLFKHNFHKNLGNIFLCSHFYHGNLRKFIGLQKKENFPNLFNHKIIENNFDDIIFFHGAKSLMVANMLLSLLMKFKKTRELSLGEIMKNNGSDKSTKHNYTKLYSVLFDKFKNQKINLFELGIGSNSENIPWNMTVNGVPAASLNSWLEYFPLCNVYAADIDENILFNTKKIKTFYCDQLNEVSIKKMWEHPLLNNLEFEIIILDGVHTFEANMLFFYSSIHKLKTGGICVIEDIHKKDLDMYKKELNKLEYWFPGYEISLIELLKSSEEIIDNSVMIFYKKF